MVAPRNAGVVRLCFVFSRLRSSLLIATHRYSSLRGRGLLDPLVAAIACRNFIQRRVAGGGIR